MNEAPFLAALGREGTVEDGRPPAGPRRRATSPCRHREPGPCRDPERSPARRRAPAHALRLRPRRRVCARPASWLRHRRVARARRCTRCLACRRSPAAAPAGVRNAVVAGGSEFASGPRTGPSRSSAGASRRPYARAESPLAAPATRRQPAGAKQSLPAPGAPASLPDCWADLPAPRNERPRRSLPAAPCPPDAPHDASAVGPSTPALRSAPRGAIRVCTRDRGTAGRGAQTGSEAGCAIPGRSDALLTPPSSATRINVLSRVMSKRTATMTSLRHANTVWVRSGRSHPAIARPRR